MCWSSWNEGVVVELNQIHWHLGVGWGQLKGFRAVGAGDGVAHGHKGPHGGW